MDSKHTPWTYTVSGRVISLTGTTVPDIRVNTGPDAFRVSSEETARLIAAAPLGLEAATDALAQMETMSKCVEEHLPAGCDYWTAMGKLRRFIETATGEES